MITAKGVFVAEVAGPQQLAGLGVPVAELVEETGDIRRSAGSIGPGLQQRHGGKHQNVQQARRPPGMVLFVLGLLLALAVVGFGALIAGYLFGWILIMIALVASTVFALWWRREDLRRP